MIQHTLLAAFLAYICHPYCCKTANQFYEKKNRQFQ